MASNAPSPSASDSLAIETMELDELRAVWAKQFGRPLALRSVDLMRLVLGWRLQAKQHGGIDKGTRRKLKRQGSIEAEGLHLGAGTTLTREWQGQTYLIHIEEDGFRWEGQLYPSLSAVAWAITETRWNGQRFFGLRSRR